MKFSQYKDSTFLKSDIYRKPECCVTYLMELSSIKTTAVTLYRKSTILIYNCELRETCINFTESIKGLIIFILSKLNFHYVAGCSLLCKLSFFPSFTLP